MELTIDTIYESHYNKVLNWIKYKIRNNDIAEELASDIFMKVHSNLINFDPNKSALNTWIMNITKNVIIDHWRTNKSYLTSSISEIVDDDGNELIPNTYTDNSSPESEIINSELGNSIDNAIASLPQTYMTIAHMFLVKQNSHEEISNALDVSIGTVKGTIHRAKELLRIRLSNL
jgi:RNA polymerase sigma-70 factor (ECF subfamily)